MMCCLTPISLDYGLDSGGQTDLRNRNGNSILRKLWDPSYRGADSPQGMDSEGNRHTRQLISCRTPAVLWRSQFGQIGEGAGFKHIYVSAPVVCLTNVYKLHHSNHHNPSTALLRWPRLTPLVCSVALLPLVRPVLRLGNPRFLVFFLVFYLERLF